MHQKNPTNIVTENYPEKILVCHLHPLQVYFLIIDLSEFPSLMSSTVHEQIIH